MALSFGDQIKNWRNKTEQRMELVFQESIQELAKEINTPREKGGNMPVDTGFLINSITAAINSRPVGPSKKPKGYSQPVWDSAPFLLVVNSAKIGDKVTVGWTAEYAQRMEFGFTGQDSLGRNYNQKGFGFVRLAVQNWPQIVKKVTRRVDKRISER